MMWNKVAAMPELLLVGINATIKNDWPYKLIEYTKLNRKNMNMSTFVKMPIAQQMIVITAVSTEIVKNRINHER